MAKRRVIEHMAPWLGMLGAGAGWLASQQVGSSAVMDDCRAGSALFVLLVGLAGLALAAAGAYFSWDVWRTERESEGRRFVGLIGLLLAGLAGFAILLQSVAGLLLPRCFG